MVVPRLRILWPILVGAKPADEACEAFVDGRVWRVPEQRVCVRRVGAGERHVARRQRHKAAVCSHTEGAGEDLGEALHALHMMVAKIKDLLLRTQRERRGNALHDIVNVCKVA